MPFIVYYKAMVEDFSGWLLSELDRRGWSYSELARRCKVSATAITDIANGKMNPSAKMCSKIAHAFGLSEEQVFRQAGHLPPAPEESATRRELLYLFEQLSDDDRERVLQIARTFASAREEQGGQLGEEPATA